VQRSAEEKAEFERHRWSANNDNDIRAVCVARRVPRVVISTQRGGSGELGCIIWLFAEPLCDARGRAPVVTVTSRELVSTSD